MVAEGSRVARQRNTEQGTRVLSSQPREGQVWKSGIEIIGWEEPA